jgi:hypothetical protein
VTAAAPTTAAATVSAAGMLTECRRANGEQGRKRADGPQRGSPG